MFRAYFEKDEFNPFFLVRRDLFELRPRPVSREDTEAVERNVGPNRPYDWVEARWLSSSIRYLDNGFGSGFVTGPQPNPPKP